jgi:DUF1680 family protein
MPLKTRLIESNPLVEENKNQVAVKRGPVVYCLESADIEGGYNINDIVIPADISLQPVTMTIAGCSFTALEGTARVATQEQWGDQLYRDITPVTKTTKIRLIPYYAWGNRGEIDMTVWMPLAK